MVDPEDEGARSSGGSGAGRSAGKGAAGKGAAGKGAAGKGAAGRGNDGNRPAPADRDAGRSRGPRRAPGEVADPRGPRPAPGSPRPSRGERPDNAAGGPGGRPRTGAPSSSRPSPGAGRPAPSREALEQRVYDPRREERRRASRVPLPDDVDARMLDPDVRRELRSLSRETADLVARHLVVTGQLLDDDPERALAHARAARALAGRVGVVREAAGLAAYAAGEWAEALSELRAARRITGLPEHLGVFADCERALGRPERALGYADDPDLGRLSQDQRVELVIVLAGARRDLGQYDAAVLTLQDPARRTSDTRPWAGRLWYAYADALLAAGRAAEAREWFGRAAQVDVEGATDAGDRVLELDGVVLEDLGEDEDDEHGDLLTSEELAEYVQGVSPPAATGPARGGAGLDAVTEPERDGAEPGCLGGGPGAEPADGDAPFERPRSGVAPPSFVAPAFPGEPGGDEGEAGPTSST